MASDHGGVFAPRLRFVRYGRKATKHVRTLFDRLWLQAEIRMAAIYFGFTSSSGNSDAEFPLLEALRTKPGVPGPPLLTLSRSVGTGLNGPHSTSGAA